MILIFPYIVLVVNTYSFEDSAPTCALKSDPIHTKVLDPNLVDITDCFFINVDDDESCFDLLVEIGVEDFEVEPLVESDCVRVIGQNQVVFFSDTCCGFE